MNRQIPRPKLKEKIIQVKVYLEKDIWRIEVKELPWYKRIVIQSLKTLFLSLKGFVEDKCQVRASALTFFSLLSVVPVIALAFAISKGFGLEKVLEETLKENLVGHEEVLNYILEFSRSMLNTTKGGLIAGIGIVVLFFSVMRLLNHIENAFNAMWEVKRPRPFMRKFADYLSIMLFAPILLILSSSATVFVTTLLENITSEYAVMRYASPFLYKMVKFLPYVLLWLLFTLLYIIMPHTKVKFLSALIAGIVAGSAFQLLQWGYINFQVGVGRYGAIYGSFAALPLFLIWLQLSWLIILLGGEISYAVQNIKKYRIDQEELEISYNYKKRLYLLIMHKIIKRFTTGKQPLTSSEIAEELEIPLPYVKLLLDDLIEVKLLVEVRTEIENQLAVLPAIDINQLSINYIIDKLETNGRDEITVAKIPEYAVIKKTLSNISKALKNTEGEILLKDLKTYQA